jgi:hypothetical protein
MLGSVCSSFPDGNLLPSVKEEQTDPNITTGSLLQEGRIHIC